MTDSGAAVGAAVNGVVKVPLWDRNGKQIEVAAADVAHFIAAGFSQAPLDPALALVEVMAAHKAMGEAIELYANGCITDGVVDHADESARAALSVAVALFGDALQRMTVAIDATYPRIEGDPVAMVDEEGTERPVDPTQVDFYTAKGWAVK